MTHAEKLRTRLAEPEILVLPVPYDALSARIAARAGAEALFLGGYASVASRFAFADIGLVTASEMLETARAVVRAAGLPVIVDGDTGYGGDANIRRTVLDLAQAGAAAVMIEDQTWPKRCGHLPGKSVVARDEAVARIRAASAARDETGQAISILARTDARATDSLDEALARVEAFRDAGADFLFMEAPRDEAEMRAFIAAAAGRPCLANMLPGGETPILPPRALREIGFAMVAHPIALLGAAGAAVSAAMPAVLAGETPSGGLSHAEILETTGYDGPIVHE